MHTGHCIVLPVSYNPGRQKKRLFLALEGEGDGEVVLVLSLLLHQVDPLGEWTESIDPALLHPGHLWGVQWRGEGLLCPALLLHGIQVGLLQRCFRLNLPCCHLVESEEI